MVILKKQRGISTFIKFIYNEQVLIYVIREESMTNDEKMYLNNIATRSFRDMADQDYIAARVCYKHKLNFQFLWMSQQCIEKYLKSILLYNQISVKKLGHNLESAIQKIHEIEYLSFSISKESKGFISYINNAGPNRYFQNQLSMLKGNELISLDETVWDIRRYAQPIKQKVIIEGKDVDLTEYNLNYINSFNKHEDKHRFKIITGYLEKRLRDNKYGQRDLLVWKNLFFGKKRKNFATLDKHIVWSIPTHEAHEKQKEFLSRFVKLT